MEKLANFTQTQLMFKLNDVGGGYFSGPGSVTYKIEPREGGFHLEQKDSNAMRSSTFGTYGKDIWSPNELKTFFEKQDFSAFHQGRAYKSEHHFIDIKNKEDFILMLN